MADLVGCVGRTADIGDACLAIQRSVLWVTCVIDDDSLTLQPAVI